MHNTISAELMKVRKNKIFLICSLVVVMSAVFIVVKDWLFITPPNDYHSWIRSSYTVTTLILGIMSGFVLTFLVQREYEDKTIINVLTAPTSRFGFLLSKLVVWFLWYVAVLLVTEIIYIIGGFLTYPNAFGFEGVKFLVISLTKSKLLGFVASIPLLWVGIMQKKMFYPSIMVSLAFTGIEMAASSMPIQAAVIPWSAVPLVSIIDVPAPYSTIGISSIVLIGIAGFVLSYTSFRKQDQ